MQVLLKSGGFPLLVLGLLLAGAGIVLVIRPMPTPSKILVSLSLLPTILGLLAVYATATDFYQLGYNPKPSEIEDIAGRALSYGFCGLLGTAVPMLLAVVALLRAHTSVRAHDTANGTHPVAR